MSKVHTVVLAIVISFQYAFPSVMVAQDGQTVNIEIRDSQYHVTADILLPEQPVTIVLQNRDTIQHGFTSRQLGDLQLEIESSGVTTYSRGVQKIHIAPGETVRIHFMTRGPGSIQFQCDLHPKMKGELLTLSVGVS